MFTLAICAAITTASWAQVVYSQDFSTDTSADWTYFNSVATDTASIGDLGGTANAFFDYSTIGVPTAPSGGSDTRGMKLQANVRGTGVFSGTTMVLNTQTFTGDYVLRFDAWQNFQGPFPGGGIGTTQMTGAGVGGSLGSQWFGGAGMTGISAYATGDGGTATDYRLYNQASGAVVGTYAGGSQNNTSIYYSGFQGTVPAAQTSWAAGQGFNSQTGSTSVGVLGMKWHRWQIAVTGNTVAWSVDGLLIATHTGTISGDRIFFAYSDINATSSTDLISDDLLFGLIDNVEVEAVPEPATMTVLGLAALVALKRRKK
jgi:hypothetical protein